MKKLIAIAIFLTWSMLPAGAQLPPVAASESSNAGHAPRPEVVNLMVSPDTVTDLHLRPNFVTAIRMPEAVRDVIVGSPALFLAEHSERDPELVTVKPITERESVSNLLIATQSGQQVSLRLISSGGDGSPSVGTVDFVLLYQHPHDFLIPSDDDTDNVSAPPQKQPISAFDAALESQQHVASPIWNAPQHNDSRSKIAAAVGTIVPEETSMVVAFSVLNQGEQWIELLPPQIELRNSGEESGKKRKKKRNNQLLDDQLAVSDYRYTARKLAPGARADGVVRFERPDFKQQAEQLALQLTTSDAADRPLITRLPFTVAPNDITK